MYPSAICRLSVPLAASIFRASIAVAETIWLYPSDATQQGVRFMIGRLENESREMSRKMDDMLA
jgi:hypothetical protein